MISRPKSRNQFLFLVHKAKHDSSISAKNLALTLWWPFPKKITGTQYHHKLLLYSSWHVPRRVLGGATKVEPGTIRVEGRTTPRDNRGSNRNDCHSKSNGRSLPGISVSLPLNNSVINPPHLSSVCQQSSRSSPNSPHEKKSLIAITLTQRAMSCCHWWNLCFLHGVIHSLIQLSCPRFVHSHPDLHLTQRMSCKLLQYPVRLLLIRQIPCYRCPPMTEVAIFMDACLMCLSWQRKNDNNML